MKRHKNDTRPSSVKSAGTDFLQLEDACLKVFNKYDVDNSGSLTHVELRNVVREELRLSNKIIPEDELKEMFLHMGGDGDGQVSAKEFAAFLSVEDHPDPEDDRVCDMINEKMRKMEIVDLVTFKMNEHLRSESERAGGAHMSWFKMFNKYDVDGTGRIDFDEMHEVIRKELGISRAKLSEDEYRYLWEHLDQGDDGFIEVQEFAEFMRGKERQQKAEQRRGRPPNQLLKEVCTKMSQAMQRIAGEGEPVTRAHWFRLFQEADDDNTGKIDHTEFTRLVRSDLGMGADELSKHEADVVWDELDDSDDSLVEVREFVRVLFASDVFVSAADARPQSRAKALQRSVSRQELRDAKAQFERGSFVGLRMATLLSRKDPAIMIPPDQPEAC